MTTPEQSIPRLQSSITKLMPALINAQAKFKPAVKDAENPHFGSAFVSLTGVLNAVTDALREQRIAVLQLTDVEPDGRTVLLTRLVHESGEWIGGRYPINPVKQDPQSYGSALTYARRYALMSLVGIAPEDDDGHAASQAPAEEPMFDTDPWVQKISAASTLDDLARVADELRTVNMPQGARTWLQGVYKQRSGELAPVQEEVLPL